MKILGIDEAGRGPVLGSLFMCGYLIEEKKVPELRKLGVKDSKLLSKARRDAMFGKIKSLSDDVVILKTSAKEIDHLRSRSNLNKLEISRMKEIIRLLQPGKVIIDALESNEKKFLSKVSAGLDGIEIVAENFADKKYLEVGAASICAKVSRDAEIESLHKIYGNFGSGYTSDPRTITFLKDCIKENSVPDCVRKSWITFQSMRSEKLQTSLNGW